MGPDGIITGESLGVVARLFGDPGEDQIENFPDDELRLWLEDGRSPWSGVTGRYWYGLSEGMTFKLVILSNSVRERAADCLRDG